MPCPNFLAYSGRRKGGDGPDKDKLKVIGAGVAVAAALVFGGVKVYKV